MTRTKLAIKFIPVATSILEKIGTSFKAEILGIDEKAIILPVLTSQKDIKELKPLINNIIAETGKDIKITCILSFDVQENQIISSLEYLGEKVSHQEIITIGINKKSVIKEEYQIF